MCQLKILLHPAPHQVEDEVLVDQKQAEKMILQGHGDYTNSTTRDEKELRDKSSKCECHYYLHCVHHKFIPFISSINPLYCS